MEMRMRTGNEITIAVDFDGTIALHEYPEIGAPVPGAIEWMKKFKEEGARVILFTMRSDRPEREYLQEAVDFVESRGVGLDGVNTNPGQESWTDSPKAYAQVYIDDAAFGCPLKLNPGGRPYVDWDLVGPHVMKYIIASR